MWGRGLAATAVALWVGVCLAAANEVAPGGVGGGGGDAAAAAGAPSVVYERDVRPIFKAHCFHCHGEDGTKEGGLDLRLRRLVVEAGGKSGPAVVPGKPDDSRLFQLVRDGKMPRGDDEKRLSEADVLTIRRWIEGGAATLRPEPA